MATVIEYRDLHKKFDVPVLAGIDLAVEKGETVSVVGPSGTGKSVLLKTTIGLLAPDRGDVLVDGESVVGANRAMLQRIRRKAGYVFQNAALFDSMNVFDNVSLGLGEDVLAGMPRTELARRVAESLEEVNLDPGVVMKKEPAELSGGMRKRVGLARAIIGKPHILLYDEPVTGLDPVNAAGVDRLIVQVAEHMGVTSIVVTHDIEGALAISDRIALLEKGRIRFLGTPAEFRASKDEMVQAFVDREAALRMAARDRGETVEVGRG